MDTQAMQPTQTAQANKDLVRRLVDELNKQNLNVVHEVIAPHFVHRNPADPDMATGPDGLRTLYQTWLTAFPDGQQRIEDQIAEGDKVVTRWSFRGTHRGELFGTAPTGKTVEFSGIFVDRIAGGKIVEHWDEADILGVMEQVGAAM